MDRTQWDALGIGRLVVFVTVVESGGFGAAATRLSLTQPAVSFHVRALKRLVGDPLFVAPRRGVELTEIGEQLFRFARSVVGDADELLDRVTEIHAGRAGRLSVGATSALGHYLAGKLLSEFHELRPQAEMVLWIGSTELLCEHIAGGDVTIAIGLESAVPAELRAEPLYDDELVLIASPQHPLALTPTVTPAMLEATPLVMSRRDTRFTALVLQALRACGVQSPRVAAEIEGLGSRVPMLTSGFGIGVEFRSSITRELESGTLRVLAVSARPIRERFALITRPETALSPLAAEFRGFLLERLAPVG